MGNTIAESKLASKAKLARNGQMQDGSKDESEDSSGSYGKRTPAGPTQQMAVYRQLQQKVKLIRAYGGCLGAKSRRRTR